MEYKLAATLYTEIDANLFAGMLKNHGIEVKINSVVTRVTRYPTPPDTFGLYVPEDKILEAKELYKTFHATDQNNSGRVLKKTLKFYSLIVSIFILIFFGYLFYQMLKEIINSN